MKKKIPGLRLLSLNTYLNYLNLAVMCIHAFLLISFSIYGIKIMAIVNFFSVSFYVVSFFFIKRKYFKIYIIGICIEALVHLACAVFCCGWDCGFQLYCFLLIPMVFFAVYMGTVDSNILRVPLIVSIIDIAVYLVGFYFTRHYEPYYLDVLTSGQELMFYMINLFILFFGLVFNVAFFVGNAVRSETILNTMAEYDELTGLNNRRYIRKILDEVYYEYITRGEKFAVAITDIDDFKNVNDCFGHDAGDFVLKNLSDRLRHAVPMDTTVGRWGGEEFIIIFHRAPGNEATKEMMDDIRSNIQMEPFAYDGHEISITVTVGLALYEEGMTIADIIRSADTRLYLGKESGKNITVCI